MNFELPDNVHVIALGHKARNGKDSISNFIKELYPNTKIIHWADELYRQVRNEDRNRPLIMSSTANGITRYLLKNEDSGPNAYQVFKFYEVPALHELFLKRGISEYMGMDEKDAEMLQFWGTGYRRKLDDLYWVDKIQERIEEIVEGYSRKEDLIITIPDTRFENEWNHVRAVIGGIYVECVRLEEDGLQFIAEDRDPKHPSEISLDGFPCDYYASANSGDMEQLKSIAQELIEITISEISFQTEAA